MKITFLGKEYDHAYFNGDYFANNNSSISFVVGDELEIDFLNSTLMSLKIPDDSSPTDTFEEIIQKILDDNQETILIAISKELNDMSKEIEFANNEFEKVLILL